MNFFNMSYDNVLLTKEEAVALQLILGERNMGVSCTHYVVLGVAITDKDKVKEFFSLEENHDDFLEQYRDNSCDKSITTNSSGIHFIVDGMGGEYVVLGKILQKNHEEGLKFTEVSIVNDLKNSEILNIDKKLGTDFSSLEAKIFAFTHWH